MKTLNGWHLIDDDTPAPKMADGHGTGYEGRDLDSFPLGSLKCCAPTAIKRMSKTEIIERIKEKDGNKSWLTDHADRVGSIVKNQKSSSYCWIHAPVRGMELARILAGGHQEPLSAFYPGSQIKGGRNQGGSGIVGVKWLAEHGTCNESEWEPMKFKGTVTPEIKASAERKQIGLLDDMPPDDYELIWTYIVSDVGVTVGIPAWGHEVLLTRLTLKGSDIREIFDNSWGTGWGTNGRGVLEGAKRRFDEAGAITAMEQSVN